MKKLRKPLLALALCIMLSVGFMGEAFAAATMGTPQNFRITKITESSVSLEWDAVPGAKKYRVCFSQDNDGQYTNYKDVSNTKYTHKVKLGDSQMFYQVLPLDGKKYGGFSVMLCASLSADREALDAEYAAKVNQTSLIIGLEQKYLDEINADRIENGSKPLEYSAELSKTAALKAAELLAYGRSATAENHTSPTYGTWVEMGIKYLGYPLSENLMDCNYVQLNKYEDAESCARDIFMSSASHRANRLNNDHRYVGFAMIFNGNDLYVCEHFAAQ